MKDCLAVFDGRYPRRNGKNRTQDLDLFPDLLSLHCDVAVGADATSQAWLTLDGHHRKSGPGGVLWLLVLRSVPGLLGSRGGHRWFRSHGELQPIRTLNSVHGSMSATPHPPTAMQPWATPYQASHASRAGSDLNRRTIPRFSQLSAYQHQRTLAAGETFHLFMIITPSPSR